MSLNLSLRTTLDYANEFQSLMNTMVMYTNFLNKQQSLEALRKQSFIEAYMINKVEAYGSKLTELDEILGLVESVDRSDANIETHMLYKMWLMHQVVNPNHSVLDRRYERTRNFLRNAEIKASVDDSGHVTFTRQDKSYQLSIVNAPSIIKLIEDSSALYRESPPEYKRKFIFEDTLNYNVELFNQIETRTKEMRKVQDEIYAEYKGYLDDTRTKIKVSSETIKKAKLRAGYTMLRNLGRK